MASNVIDFLEQMGSNAQLRQCTGPGLEEALRQAGIEAPVRAALLDRDQHRLESLLGANHILCCAINAPEEEESEEEDDEDGEGREDDSEDDEDSPDSE